MMPRERTAAHTHYCARSTQGAIVFVPASLRAVRVGMLGFERDHVKRPMSNPAFRHQAFSNQSIELTGQGFIDGNGETVHGGLPGER